MEKLLTNKNLIIIAVLLVLIFIYFKFIRNTNSTAASTNIVGNNTNNNTGSGTHYTGTYTGSNSIGTTVTTPATVVDTNIGKTAYANQDGVPVYNGSIISNDNLYKTAKKDEWIGTVANKTSAGSPWYFVSGGRVVHQNYIYTK